MKPHALKEANARGGASFFLSTLSLEWGDANLNVS